MTVLPKYTWPSFFNFMLWISSFERCARLFNWSTVIRISRGFYESMVFRIASSYASCGFSSEYERFMICVYTNILCLPLQDANTRCGRWCSGIRNHVLVFILSLLQCVFLWHFRLYTGISCLMSLRCFSVECRRRQRSYAVMSTAAVVPLTPHPNPPVSHNFQRTFCQSHFSECNSCSRVVSSFWPRYLSVWYRRVYVKL
jgi:hypothetical protein